MEFHNIMRHFLFQVRQLFERVIIMPELEEEFSIYA